VGIFGKREPAERPAKPRQTPAAPGTPAPAAAAPAAPISAAEQLAALHHRLAETEQHPLKRIPSADLDGEARDIAERINTKLDALASAEKEQQQFIADVSHELRTPLTVLRGSLEVVLEEDRPAEEYREAIGNALLEVRHLSRLSQNLLFLARGQAGRITLSFANVDLVRFVADVTRDLQPAASDRSIDLTAELSDETIRAFIDGDRMQQVLHNLLENAIRYTGEEGRVRVRLSATREEATIEVVDSGIGIPARDIPHVFERFYRSDRARRAYPGGSGLGLSIARWIVDAHKGRVEVESVLDQGTTFRVKLPLIS
jgi:signal transduction histidine kinase